MSDEYTRYPRMCTLCGRHYQWSADDLAWLYEQTPHMPCSHPWRFMQDKEEDMRVFEIKTRQADDPEADRTYYYRLLEVKEHFPQFYELVRPQGFIHATLSYDLTRTEMSVCS